MAWIFSLWFIIYSLHDHWCLVAERPHIRTFVVEPDSWSHVWFTWHINGESRSTSAFIKGKNSEVVAFLDRPISALQEWYAWDKTLLKYVNECRDTRPAIYRVYGFRLPIRQFLCRKVFENPSRTIAQWHRFPIVCSGVFTWKQLLKLINIRYSCIVM